LNLIIKQLIYLFSFIVFINAQTYISPGVFGDELSDFIIDDYKTSFTLGYNSARDTLYLIIDNDQGSVSGVYSNFSVDLIPGTDPSTTMYSGGINCEHVWPQSMGAASEPMKSDLHHLFPCKDNVNSSRSNNPYGEILDDITDSWFYLNNTLQSIPPTNMIDKYSESHTSSSEDFFEPREDRKGDIARSIFYFYTMYSLVADQSFFDIQKDILFQWHYYDPSNSDEADRTWEIASYQENIPNPFIIDPTLIWRIYFSESHPLADINSDQMVDVLDIVLVANDILNLNNLTGLQNHQSDLNADFDINVLDILMIVSLIIN